jgi:hypothetical protein
MMQKWMDAQRRFELWERLCQLTDELQAIAHFWWELDPYMQPQTAEDAEQHPNNDGKLLP